MEVTLYSIGCPQCKVLEMLLERNKINYNLVMGAEEMQKRGFKSAPILEVNGEAMAFPAAMKWIKGEK